jgi:hypothetical protein
VTAGAPRVRAAVLLSLLTVAPGALAFTVEVGEIIGFHSVEVTATALDRAALLKLVNHDGSAAAECELHIDSGPEERVRRVSIRPLGSRIVSQSIRSSTQRVRVRVSGVCR